jgi:putative nucleotidyltransferase with HDIG domain
MSKKPSILLVIEDEAFYEDVQAELGDDSLHLHFAKDLAEARKYLEDPNFDLNGVFVNPDVSDTEGIRLLKVYHENHIPIPFYLIAADLEKYEKGLTIEKMGVHGQTKSAIEVAEMLFRIQEGMKKFEQAKESQDIDDGSAEKVNDITFIPIKIQNFITGQKSYFDVYMKLNSHKYVKVIKAGDEIDLERMKKYSLRGVGILYIKKTQQEHYLNFCEKLAKKVLSTKKIHKSAKINKTFNHGQEVLKFLTAQGLDKDKIEYARSFSINVYELVTKLSGENKLIKSFMNNIVSFEHAIGVSMLAGLMGRNYGLEAQECIEVLGVAACLHDIGLCKRKTHYSEDDDLLFYEEEKIESELNDESTTQARKDELWELYKEHPQRAVEIIGKLKLNPVVIQIIKEHHKWNDGKKDVQEGFHKLDQGGVVHPLAQIVGLCDEFSKLIRQVGNHKLQKEDLQTFLQNLAHYNENIGQLFLKTMTK